MQLLHPPGSLVLDGRTFRSVGDEHPGTVDRRTRFDYVEGDDGVVTAEYAGGDVVSGRLVGRRVDDRLEHRYSHLEADGTLASGSCSTTLAVLDDGRVRLEETWEWTSRSGSGSSVLEETVELADDRLDVELRLPDRAVVLRPLQMSDAAAIATRSADPEIHRFTFITEPLTLERSQRRVSHSERARRAGRGARLVVVEDTAVVGETGVFFAADRHAAEIYYWLAADVRGRGLGTAVLRSVVDWASDTFEVARLALVTHPDNVASRRIATKAGFTHEGRLRSHIVIDGVAEDVEMYSLVTPV